MLQPHTLTLFSASAGSGKTHRLVQTYLYLCLKTDRPNSFYDILAITFTRKATAEMKERIVKSLNAWVSGVPFGASDQMRMDLITLLEIDESTFQQRAGNVLQYLLHHYGYFSVTTIDALTHRIVRSFSQDLGLPAGFDLEMDKKLLVAEAVDRLMDEYGENELVTRLLRSYGKYLNEEEEKSWFVRNKLLEQTDTLLKSARAEDLEHLHKWLDGQFDQRLASFSKKSEAAKQQFLSIARDGLHLISSNGLRDENFSYKDIPNYFRKNTQLLSPFGYKKPGTRLESQLNGDAAPYPGKVKDEGIRRQVEQLVPQLYDLSNDMAEAHQQWLHYFHIRQRLYAVALLSRVTYHLQEIQRERNLLLIEELGSLIEKELKEQPSAYLFERIGERYRQLFIDEFQDTSRQQWGNLQAFVDDLMGHGGQLMLVGDAKQAIYRWRGGDVQQFMEIFQKGLQEQSGFSLELLSENWRSQSEIVHFNNLFFRHCAALLAEDPLQEQLYLQGEQQAMKAPGEGYVEIRRPTEEADNARFKEWHDEEVIRLIQELVEDEGYVPKDIAVLYRNKATAERLIPKLLEAGLEVSSEQGESMENCIEVNFLMDLLRLYVEATDAEAQRRIIYFFLQNHRLTNNESFSLGQNMSKGDFWKALSEVFEGLDAPILALGSYELLQHWIRVFHLAGEADAYLWRLLSECLQAGSKPSTDPIDLVRWWEERGNQVVVEQADREEAVRLMTLHKAKGLQFPVVIMAEASWPTYKLTDNLLWMDLEGDQFDGLKRFPYEAKKWDMAEGRLFDLWQRARQDTLLDHINLLYVGFTRAEERLYILSQEVKNLGQNISSVVQSFLDAQNRAGAKECWGQKKSKVISEEKEEAKEEIPQEPSIGELHLHSRNWQASIQIAVRPMFSEEQSFGNRFHDAAMHCESREDWEKLAQQQPELAPSIQKLLAQMEQPEYGLFFQGWESLNERGLSDSSGQMLRPDRVVIDPEGQLHILDYKTGEVRKEHEQQLLRYKDAFTEAGFTVASARLLYI